MDECVLYVYVRCLWRVYGGCVLCVVCVYGVCVEGACVEVWTSSRAFRNCSSDLTRAIIRGCGVLYLWGTSVALCNAVASIPQTNQLG